ncbi:hypothetical protein ECDEC12A_0033 [Escherichia coli DEC12A]|nr:hypothetical protein ECE128010_0496 [Escherichia coli E128010]EHX24082.1 hypothetical protein ECDEC12C_5342 [Escherichia coli DEC12C]EHX37053.1 hypothetical protein ECDEC12A_0033 [Escherichia coli DEC12A]EIQ57952.1 hypothetical protein ECEPECA12_5169 [Escherichia coli EPECa12]EIQ72990.1 hypothetical protein ECEPECC34262_0035 [Escherichia coli EPEC C342-62]
MKPVTADLPHIDRHLFISGFNPASFRNNDALKLHISAGQRGIPFISGQSKHWQQRR